MSAVGMTTLDCQRQNLEKEIIKTKDMIWSLKQSDFPDLAYLGQLRDKVERNMQLINMIDQHLYATAQKRREMRVN